MEPRTRQHLDTARRNRVIARVLVTPTVFDSIQPPPFEWAAVVAFYAAVHYVNAYLWEKLRVDPGSHDNRSRAVATHAALRRTAAAYSRLSDMAYRARYVPGFRMSRTDARELLDGNLESVRRAVHAALNISE